MPIPTHDLEFTVVPDAPEVGMSRPDFQSKAAAFAAWYITARDELEAFRLYLNALDDAIEESLSVYGSEAIDEIDSAIAAAAASAAATVENQTIGVAVNVSAGGSYTFPSTILDGEQFNFFVSGDMSSNPATVNTNGHKINGETMIDFDYNENFGATFYYKNATDGLRVKL